MRKLHIAALLSFVAIGQASASPPASSAIATVARLYKVYAWEAVIDEPNFSDTLFSRPRQILEKYFDEHLVKLILRDRECKIRTGGICQLDFAPIWNSQDPSATQLKVIPTDNPSIVSVQFRYSPTSKAVELKYTLSRTSSGWRISDIQSSTWSLERLLSSEH